MSIPLNPPCETASDEAVEPFASRLDGEKLCLVGRFVSAPRKRLAVMIAELGGQIVVARDKATLIVEGEGGEAVSSDDLWPQPTVTETQLLERLGMLEADDAVKRLYTPAMLADLAGAPIVAIRRWERRGYLQPSERLGRLTRYDFAQANLAQMLSALLTAGRSLAAIDRIVEAIERAHPELERPLVSLPLVVAEGTLLVRDGDRLSQPDGQRRLDFTAAPVDETDEERPAIAAVLSIADAIDPPPVTDTVEATRQAAFELRDAGDAAAALERYRVVTSVEPPSAEDHFTLAELLYEVGDATAARERYYAALEQDADYLEARVNLGCLLAAEGDLSLAIAAFEGALDCYEPYADAHYHLATTLDRVGRPDEADKHWLRFLETAPESPWADEARERLGKP